MVAAEGLLVQGPAEIHADTTFMHQTASTRGIVSGSQGKVMEVWDTCLCVVTSMCVHTCQVTSYPCLVNSGTAAASSVLWKEPLVQPR